MATTKTGLTLGALLCGALACGGSSSTTSSTGTSTASSTSSGSTSSGTGTSGTTSGTGTAATSTTSSSSGAATGGNYTAADAGLSGQIAFPFMFEGEGNGKQPDGETPVSNNLQVVYSSADLSSDCSFTSDTPIPLPSFNAGTQFLYLTVNTDGGPLMPATYSITSTNAEAGTPLVTLIVKQVTRDGGPVVEEGTATDGTITLTQMSGTLAAGSFQVDMQDPLGNSLGPLSGSFSPNVCQGIPYWQ